jgi:hypothetical protein
MSDWLEFYSLPHVAALGRRKMILSPPEEKTQRYPKHYEVYARLVSGSTFALASKISYAKAKKIMIKFAQEMGDEGGTVFVTLQDECIPFEHVARIYIDTQENEFVAIMEDSSSAHYIIERGSESRCRSALEEIAGAVLEYMQTRRTGNNAGPTAAVVQSN